MYFCNFKNNPIMKKVIHTNNAPAAIGPYSQAIEANGMLFISGQIPVNPADGTVPEGITAQTEQVMKNIAAILDEAGYTFDNVVKTTCLLSDIANFAAMNEVYATRFPSNPPARAAFAVRDLPKGVMVEIEVIAVK
jgi:2-iminobutanoate/2-iminopropanoate deaminase